MTNKINGAQAIIKCLEQEGVEVVFGYPGGAILPVYDPLLDSDIRHVLVRHEQGAGHMAEGFAHTTGKAGVCIVTSGPGATNVVTALADAYLDSIPLVCISGQVAVNSIGTDAFQECDTTGITRSITKHNFLVTKAEDIPRVMAEAFYIASTGRPGPVLVDIPKSITDHNNPDAYFDWYYPDSVELPGYSPAPYLDDTAIDQAIDLMFTAERPVLYVGGGVLKARGSEALLELAELAHIPVVTTLMARGAFPDSHELCLGMPGMHGNYTAVTAIQQSDLLIAMGSRFDDRVTGKVDAFAANSKIVHVDIDPAEHGKIKNPDVSIVADCRLVMEEMLTKINAKQASFADRSEWLTTIKGWQEKYPLVYNDSQDGQLLKPQFVIEQLSKSCPDDTIVAAGVGQHQMWVSQFWKFDHPYTWVNSGGAGTMGFAVPAAIGAKAAVGDRMVWAVDGDGCFQMTGQELITAAVEKIPIKVALINNAYLGMVRQWQELFYDKRYSEVYLGYDTPDYVKWAESMGCVAFRVDKPEDVSTTIDKANQINDRPVLIDFRCDSNEKVYPMVPAMGSNDDIIVHPSQAPDSKGDKE